MNAASFKKTVVAALACAGLSIVLASCGHSFSYSPGNGLKVKDETGKGVVIYVRQYKF